MLVKTNIKNTISISTHVYVKLTGHKMSKFVEIWGKGIGWELILALP